jgi:hypothetical protein
MLRLKSKKTCVVGIYTDIEEVVVVATKIERVLGQLRENKMRWHLKNLPQIDN